MKYSAKAKSFIKKVMRIRKHINNNGTYKRSFVLTSNNIESIKINLQAYPNRNDRQMAGFFAANAHKIKSLIPGTTKITALITEFDQLLSEANNIIHAA